MTVHNKSRGFPPARESLDPEVHDFQKKTTLARDQSRVLEMAFESFSRQWGTQLTAHVRGISRVTFEKLIVETYEELVISTPDTSAMVLCTIDDNSARAIVEINATSALSWIGRMLGGNGTIEPAGRKFTPVEHAIMLHIMTGTLDDLKYSLGSLLPGSVAVESIQYNAQFAQAASTNELMIVAFFTVQVGERTSAASIAIPADILLPQLGGTRAGEVPVVDPEVVAAHVAAAPLEVALQLRPVAVSPGLVLGLTEGDLIPLNHPQYRPLIVTAGGQAIATAASGTSGARLAFVVVTTEESA